MRAVLSSSSAHTRIRADGWTHDRRVTFLVSLAASGSVTFASSAAGLSRKSAYALRMRDPAFATVWDRSLAAADAACRKMRRTAAKGDETDGKRDPRHPSTSSTASASISNLAAASLPPRITLPAADRMPCPPGPLAFAVKESDATRL